MVNFADVVADIGGTNLRIGMLNDQGETQELVHYQCADYDSLEAILTDFIGNNVPAQSAIRMCLAIACPVDQDIVKMTNLPWSFSKKALVKSLSLNKLLVINDYTAIGLAIPQLTSDQLIKVGGGEVNDEKPISVCGPGTGLGVATLIRHKNEYICIDGEGGHVDFAPVDEQEITILRYLNKHHSRVSAEQVLCGNGIEQVYRALAEKNQQDSAELTAAQISDNAINNRCDLCVETLNQFCRTLGSFAGNLALTSASLGGVYIAGGIVPRFPDFVKNSDFRARFEAKGRFNKFNSNIPTYIITESQPGIIGAGAYLRQHNQEDL